MYSLLYKTKILACCQKSVHCIEKFGFILFCVHNEISLDFSLKVSSILCLNTSKFLNLLFCIHAILFNCMLTLPYATRVVLYPNSETGYGRSSQHYLDAVVVV